MPLSARIAAADAAYRDRPAQAEAEARAPARPAPDLSGVDPEYLSMVEQLRDAVARNPDDPEGLSLLATHEMRLGNLPAAREAQARLVELSGDAAQPAALMQLATLMIEAAGGVITPEAEALLDRALQRDATLPQARYLRGVLFIQNGRPDLAFPIWRRLLEEGPESAPWIPSIREAIEELAWLAGDDEYRAPPAAEAAPLPGPDADALAAAGAMSAEDQQQMARDMVARLQGRLAEQGGAPEEWARLIAGLAVLGEAEQARAILAEARQRFGQIPEAIAPIDRAATEAGLER
ncbi:tetratricopeptide repeat protein [Paracoccus sp. ME4]|uniref:tetratricopeptide repeat protein n=1 Tax=Paracoccus sp. ME4 TaxID=3138066 RepID=UPI00398A8334